MKDISKYNFMICVYGWDDDHDAYIYYTNHAPRRGDVLHFFNLNYEVIEVTHVMQQLQQEMFNINVTKLVK